MKVRRLIKSILKKISPSALEHLGILWINYYMRTNPRILANRAFKNVFGRNIDWNNPCNLIEKIYWLQLCSDTSLWTLCADKYRVRDYVSEKIGAKYLNTLYGKWDTVDELDFNALPNSFVLKTNHGSGEVIIVRDKAAITPPHFDLIIKQLRDYLNENYGFSSVQPHYTRIKPCIIAEKLLVNPTKPEASIIDYKFWCFNGRVECCLVIYNRTKEGYKASVYDKDWNNISEQVLNRNHHAYGCKDIPKPESYDEMTEICKILSANFPEVRVDLYEIDRRPIFGELTFSTGYGYFTDEFYDYLGSQVVLPQSTKQIK